jgi:hypothetical protein
LTLERWGEDTEIWQTFQESGQICSPFRLCSWSNGSGGGTGFDAALGEGLAFVCGEGRIRTDYEIDRCDWSGCWIFDVLSTINTSVSPSSPPIPPINPAEHITFWAIVRFYGFTENKREVDLDMREMVNKVKKGEPLYGVSTLTPYMQGVASRNSRYTGIWLHVIPWFNFVNHNQHGVDTAKYYQQAEKELEAEKSKK